MNDVIIYGLAIKPQSYLQAVKGIGLENRNEHDETTEEQVTAFLHGKNIDIENGNIEACHHLPAKNIKDRPTMPAVIIRFTNRKHAVDLLRQGRKLKGTKYLHQ